ncbi:triose-phosphate transporter family-domain-containing protein [Armillaria novae-zelandiae]|uniref:Triose-phosphate transporter family-domain-containing protein n=1 Tax=Armillaria novae-zelandiae TaxID=153914 RepID=A0AA39PRB8_9AGAR|nr:triose-phosphate transporter family-domain-containing protein [Armillaria novae-zelandiae]
MLDHATLLNGYHDKQRQTVNDSWQQPTLPLYANDWSSDRKPRLDDVRKGAATTLSHVKQLIGKPWSRTGDTGGRALTNPSSPPSNLLFIFLCSLWYTSSALSSNTGKAILNQFRYPVTLTFIQFGFVAIYCLLFMSPIIRFTRLKRPSRAIFQSTLPMGVFQVGGHIFSSMAISTIPVSTVHTIKALSPLFTVAAYALLFRVSYSAKTYVSLLPLTVGVMLACSFDMTASNYIGLLCAFGSAVVFVTSNIFFKKVMPSNDSSQPSHVKLDKLNLLFYSSSMAFVLMIPIWLYYDLPVLLAASHNPEHVVHPSHAHSAIHSVTYYVFMNGTVHFGQNIIAFIILSSTSPVTYSIASLIKRVVVICVAIVWFNQSVHPIQVFGIGLTFTGLYMYNNAKADVDRGEKKMRRVEAARDLMLPSTTAESKMMSGTDSPPAATIQSVGEGETTGAAVTWTGRSRTSSIHHHHHPPHPAANLSVKITPPILSSKFSPIKEGKMGSPTDSYPSPPPSLDSPPSHSIHLGYLHGHSRHSLDPRRVEVPA